MTYRGHDIELRTPIGRGGERRDLSSGDTAIGNGSQRWARDADPRADAFYVDETVLACCNHAYDLALAHGASHVRLEHLLHALTRVEAAAQALERAGVREAQLRRESASLMISEAPIALVSDRGSPRRSEELVAVLGESSAAAARRGAAASVEDLLDAMLAYPRDLPAVVLLRTHAPNWQRTDRGRPRERVVSRADMRLEPVVVQSAAESRLEGVEGALRSLRAELASDRKALGDMMREIQRDVSGRMAFIELSLREPQHLPAALMQQVRAVEVTVDERLKDAQRLWGVLADRLQGLERTLEGRAAPPEMLTRVDALQGAIAAPLAQLSERIASIELQLAEPATAPPEQHQMTERLQTLERAVQAGMAEGARNWASLAQRLPSLDAGAGQPASERLAGIERLIEARGEETSRASTLLADRLLAVERALRTTGGDANLSQIWPAIGQRLQTVERMIETRASEQTSQTKVLGDRLRTLEEVLAAQRAEFGQMRAHVSAHMKTIETNGGAVGADLSGVQGLIAERFHALKRDLEAVRVPGGSALEQRIGGLETIVTARHGEVTQRLGAIDTAIQGTLRQVRERDEKGQRDLTELQEALVRLSENQQALSASLREWRLDTQGDLSIINNQLGELSRQSRASAAAAPAVPVSAGYGSAPVVAAAGAAAAAAARAIQSLAPAPSAGASRVNGSDQSHRAAPAPVRGADPLPPPPTRTVVVDAEGPEAKVARGDASGQMSQFPHRGRTSFWMWLFGTHDVRQANRDVDVHWDRLRGAARPRRDV